MSNGRLGERLQLRAVVTALREKERLVVNPRYRYDMRSVIMALNNESIDSIKQEFIVQGHVDLQKFIWLLRHAIDNQADEALLYYELTRLFEEIDIDGSNTIEWPEFLEYLSESAFAALPGEGEGKVSTQERRVLFRAFSEEVKYRKQAIKKVVEVQRAGLLAVVTKGSSVEFIDYQGEDKAGRTFALQSVDHERVLALDYAEEERLFGVLMANRNLCFVEDGEMQKNLGVIRSSGAEVDIRYLPIHRLWALESSDSTLHLFPSPKGAVIQTQLLFRPHHQPLTALREIASPATLCTSSLDGTIRLWQAGGRLLIELSAKRERGGQERKGVKGMATFSRGALSYICSWMFTSQILLWLPSLSLSKPFAGELRGHVGLVLDCVFTQRGEVVSLDDRRGLRVWNPERFECVQSITLEQEGQGLFALRGRPYVVVYAKLMEFFRVRTGQKADLQKEIGLSGLGQRNVLAVGDGSGQLVGIGFSSYYCSFVAVTSRQAKIMQVNSGSVVATVLAGSEQVFVSMTMQRKRRVLIGSSRGVVYEHKMEDGALVRVLNVCSSAESVLRFVHFHEASKMLLAVVQRADCSQLLTFDCLAEEDERIKEIEFEQVDLLAFEFDSDRERFFVLSEQCLTVWEYEKLVVLVRVEARELMRGGFVGLKVEQESGVVLVLSEGEAALVRVHEEGEVDRMWLKVDCQKNGTRTRLAAGAILKERVPTSYLDDICQRRTRRKMPGTKKKMVSFEGSNQDVLPEAEGGEVVETSVTVLALTDSFGETHYYHVSEYFKAEEFCVSRPLKAKLGRLKEKRLAHIKRALRVRGLGSIDLSLQLFTEQVICVSKSVAAGAVAGHFYLYTSSNSIHFFNIYGVARGEWVLALSRPKSWRVSYNELDDVLARLIRAEQALTALNRNNNKRFKIEFLIAKYLTAEEVANLVRCEERKKIGSKATLSRIAASRKSLLQYSSFKDLIGNDNIKDEIKEEVPIEANIEKEVRQGESLAKEQNIFTRKLEYRDYKSKLKKNSIFYQKIQQTLKLQRPVVSNVPRMSTLKVTQTNQSDKGLVHHLECYFDGQGEKQVFDEISVAQRDGRRSSATGFSRKGERPLSCQGIAQRRVSEMEERQLLGSKGRLQASVSELNKNFKAGKQAYSNYQKRSEMIIDAANGSLGKRKRLRLQL